MKVLKVILKVILAVIIVLAAAAAGLAAFLSLTEYKPQDVVNIEVQKKSEQPLKGTVLSAVSFNIGYAGLGDNADFFMDGGSGVVSADRERVLSNMEGITGILKELDPDFILLQETDLNSARTYGINEGEMIQTAFPSYDFSFAYNFKTPFVPYPLPPIGRVESGIGTLSRYQTETASRIALPCPFSWPVRTVNLKRCLLINRIPLETGKELVLVNLHLEAYDDGAGKAAQTAMLREILDRELAAGNYIIAGGDFNQTFSSTDISKYPAQEGKWQSGLIDVSEFGEEWQFLMDNKVPSCRSLDQPYAGADRDSFQYYVIDGFLVSPNITVNSLETLDEGFVYSDHNPVYMTFTLNEAE